MNINGCADHVQVGYNTLSESFNVGGDLYTLNVLGFEIGGVTQHAFLTEEAANDSALLIADVTLRSLAVPEPFTLAMFASGLLGLGMVRRRRC